VKHDEAHRPVRQRPKIVSLDELAAVRDRFRDRRIVLCHGAFDLVHMGHLLHFEEAAALGDILVVTLTADKFITKKRSVSFSEHYRLRQVAALEVVDYVALVQDPSAVPALEALKPDVYVKGSEYANLVLDKSANIFREKHIVESYGGQLYFTTAETFSSTKLSHFLLAAPEASQNDPLLRNDGLHARRGEAVPRRRVEAARVSARRNDHRRVGRRHGHEPVAEIALRGRPGNRPCQADGRHRRDRTAPGQLRRARACVDERA
jgi:cytidyltransferase-like protein